MEYKETLEKQLRLLSEHSEKATDKDIVEITKAMVEVAKVLISINQKALAILADKMEMERKFERFRHTVSNGD
ncbi:MAG: hypothetical protein IJT82_01370 [Schwartzia sp.]|nr:hypothetical protein [Schwartzia sp. (in: firmicutes)]